MGILDSNIEYQPPKICNLPFPVLIVDEALRIQEISNAAIRLLEIDNDIPQTLPDIITDIPEIPIRQFVKNRELEKTISLQTKNRELKWLR